MTGRRIGLSDFAGRWRLVREIEDRRAGQTGRFEGAALFTAEPGGLGLEYAETGTLRLGASPPLQATRRYLWRPEAGGAIAVFFENGRPFHAFHTDAKAGAVHLCDPDTYRVAYDFSRWPDWSAVWDVTGPRKDYSARACYSPCEAAGAQAKPE